MPVKDKVIHRYPKSPCDELVWSESAERLLHVNLLCDL